jgi:hypothetical protein
MTVILVLAISAAASAAETEGPATSPFAAVADSTGAAGPPPEIVTAIVFRSQCGRCHGSDRPASGLSLRPEHLIEGMVDVPSRKVPELKLIDTTNPDKSYLLMKIRGDEGIVGLRMPLGREPLNETATAAVEAWVDVVASSVADTAAAAEPEPPEAPETPAGEEAPAAPHAEQEAEPAPEEVEPAEEDVR